MGKQTSTKKENGARMVKLTDYESVLDKLSAGDKVRAKFKSYFKASNPAEMQVQRIKPVILPFKSIDIPSKPFNWNPLIITVISILICLLVVLSLIFVHGLSKKSSTRIIPELNQPNIKNYYITPTNTITNNITYVKEKVIMGENHSCVKFEYGDSKQFYLECDT